MGMPGAAVQEVLRQIAICNFCFNFMGVPAEACAGPRILTEHIQGLPPYFQADFHAGVQLAIMEQTIE